MMMRSVMVAIILIISLEHANAQSMGGMDMSHTTKKPKAETVKTTAQQPMIAAPTEKRDSIETAPVKTDMNDMDGMKMDSAKLMNMEGMSSAYSLNLPMERNGSGTAWLPDASPMYGYMAHAGKWMLMFHGNQFVRYDKQDLFNKGTRGNEKWDGPDFFMAMGQRKIGKHGLIHFSTMFSLDALIQGGEGYPLLFQTGESWKGVPLIDRQHPHDLFSELSVAYTYSFSNKSDLSFYLGYPGEPAIGSVAFMHRPSAYFNPDAPISHHWNDGTHITFGVATIGYWYSKFKFEGSAFTGREPDENRYNFDKPNFNSYSGRVSYCPSTYWSLQVSQAYIKSPEATRPNEDVVRSTASAIYSHPLGSGSYFDATAIFGQNKTPGQAASNALLFEASIKLKKAVVYTRYEFVQKSGEELSLDEKVYGSNTLYAVNALTIGAAHDVYSIANTKVAIGAQLTFNHSPAALTSLYGENPMGGEVYLHIYIRGW